MNIITIKCPKHGEQKLNIKDYFEKEKKYIYYSIKCSATGLEQRVLLCKNQYFSHCFQCGQNLCLECVKRHHCNPLKLLKVNEINDKCIDHLHNYYKYCFTCNKNCCKKCNCQHNDIKKIEKANNEDIEKIKEKKKTITNLH